MVLINLKYIIDHVGYTAHLSNVKLINKSMWSNGGYYSLYTKIFTNKLTFGVWFVRAV